MPGATSTRQSFQSRDRIVPMSQEQIAWIGIPTCNRSKNLQLCVQSFAECVTEHARKIQFLVVDQTQDQSQLELDRQIVKATASKEGVEVWFADPSEVREFANTLSQHANLPPDLVALACCGDDRFPINTGANRNTLLLATAGKMLLQVDDDTVCRIELSPEIEEGLVLSSEYDCMEIWFPPSTEALEVDRSSSIDICALHEELLGRQVDECIGNFGPPTVSSSKWSDRLTSQEPSARRTVVATSIGLKGDSPVPTNLYLMQSNGNQRERLVESEAVYRYIMEESQIFRAVRQRTISDRGLVSSSNFGIDNRSLLPPFSPVQQGQDSVFTALLHSCFDSYVGFLPFMARHVRPERRVPSTEVAKKRTYLRSGDLIWMMIYNLSRELTATTSEARLAELGKLIVERASAPPAKFQEMVRGMVIIRSVRHLSEFDQLLQTHQEQPEYWASDLKSYRAWIRKTIPDPELDVTDDLLDAVGTTQARILIQEMALKFGQLLQIWPALHRAAIDLHAQGIRVGTRV
jgi:hypothetical protein